MRISHGTWWLVVAIGLGAGVAALRAQELPELPALVVPPPPTAASNPSEEMTEVLARGPVHEAFAEQVSPDPQPGIVAPEAPPEPVKEEPPDWRPEGADVTWIPGYWFWDDERETYLWVSGVWRRVPPDREWIAGYWQPVEGGYQWIAGYWAPLAAPAPTLLAAPPPSLDFGPNSPAASTDVFWNPGTWAWSTAGEYRWRPGHWQPFRSNWTWVSDRYIWTPGGCIFVPGYWDFTLARRGFLFAPVRFRAPLYTQVGFVYRPQFWIGYDSLLLHLFVSPRHCHLFFGDYYAPIYRQRHFMPCYDFHSQHRGFASLYVYYEHYYRRQGIDYCGRVRDWHTHLAMHADERPVHTHPMQSSRPEIPARPSRRSTDDIVRPFRAELSAGQHQVGGHALVPVAAADRDRWHRQADRLREATDQRQRIAHTLPVTPGQRDPEARVPGAHERDGGPRRGEPTPGRDTRPRRIADTLPVTPGQRDPEARVPGVHEQDGGLRRGEPTPGRDTRPRRIADTLPVTPGQRDPEARDLETRLPRIPEATGGPQTGPQPRGGVENGPGRIANTLPVTPGPRVGSPGPRVGSRVPGMNRSPHAGPQPRGGVENGPGRIATTPFQMPTARDRAPAAQVPTAPRLGPPAHSGGSLGMESRRGPIGGPSPARSMVQGPVGAPRTSPPARAPALAGGSRPGPDTARMPRGGPPSAAGSARMHAESGRGGPIVRGQNERPHGGTGRQGPLDSHVPH